MNNDNGAPPAGGGWKPSASPSPSTATIAGRSVPGGPPPSNVRPPSAPRNRKPALAALGLLLVLVGALASVYLQQRAGNRVGVVEIVKRVPQGQAITTDSIGEVMVAVDSNISYVTWAQARAGVLHGYTARTDLLPGTLLVGQMLTTVQPLSQGQEVVGLSLKDGQYPIGIQVGDTVSAYYVSNKNDDKTGQAYLTDGFTTPPIVASVRVYDVGTAATNGVLDVSLVLSQQSANAVTQAASGGNLVLVFDKHTQ
ncbi:hypothetical protein [Actinocrinis sp.]|uniref:hypothetical protein n=1 Tax=Actinocrinis sp. TaxID=1920516 RepID=UPI002D772886|nr:hypothetical protein [Actinocrinis sp.]